ncbi:MAG: TetR/AcrR family transcriptional regulator [Chloroflexi bacterium]|nr:TetR/AcrR family transcriptional regulator [Chloroflexota bacterium]
MPYPRQISRERIIAQAWEMIKADGSDKLSLSKLATSLGVKAPSLYRHVRNKANLLQGVNLHTSQQLIETLKKTAVLTSGSAQEQLLALLLAYRSFAHMQPNCYILAFTNNDDALRPDEDLLEQMVLPIQELMTVVSGPENSLSALRGAMALVHGFVMLELHNQLRRGGDLSASFEAAVQAYLRGWQTNES